MIVEVFHSGCDLLGPFDQSLRRDLVFAIPEEVKEGPVRAELHDNAEAGGLVADSFEADDVGMVELAQMVDRRVRLLLDLLDSDELALPFAHKNRTLSTRSQPLEVRDGLERDLPIICK